MPWYTVRSHKRLATQPELPWSNTAEMYCSQTVVPEQAQGGMEAWRVFERQFTHSLIEFHDATFSSWTQEEEDEVVPDELFQYLGDVDQGQRQAPAAPSPLDDTLFLSRLPNRGQKGKLFLRGCIEEPELQIFARKRVLKPAALAGFELILGAAFENLQINLGQFGLQLGMVSYPRVGWEAVPVLPGAKPKYKPVYGNVLYERIVVGMRVRGTTPLQLRQS